MEEDVDILDPTALLVEVENPQEYVNKFKKGELSEIRNIVLYANQNKIKLIKKLVKLGSKNITEHIGATMYWKKGQKEYIKKKVKNYEIMKEGNSKKLKLFITELDRRDIINNYSIPPTMVSLSSGGSISAREIFGDQSLDKNHMYSIHTHYLPLDISQEYAYKIGCFQTGYNLNNNVKKAFLGVIDNDAELGMGEVYSKEAYLGQPINNVQQNNKEVEYVEEKTEEPKEVLEPIIKYFEPKEGTENTIVRIVGNDLDKLDYICFRDVKVKILKKQKRIIIENDKKISYDEYLVKPPTLKELDRECWQSYDPYKVLIWGYFHGTGKQIRSKETTDPDSKMYKYLVRSICPESNKLIRKYEGEVLAPSN